MSWCLTYTEPKHLLVAVREVFPFLHVCTHTHTYNSGSNFLSQRNINCHFQPWFSNKSPKNHTFRLEGTCGVTSSNWYLRAYCQKQSPASIFTATGLFHLALRWRDTNSISTERICSDSTTSKCLQLCSLKIKNKLFFFFSFLTLFVEHILALFALSAKQLGIATSEMLCSAVMTQNSTASNKVHICVGPSLARES